MVKYFTYELPFNMELMRPIVPDGLPYLLLFRVYVVLESNWAFSRYFRLKKAPGCHPLLSGLILGGKRGFARV